MRIVFAAITFAAAAIATACGRSPLNLYSEATTTSLTQSNATITALPTQPEATIALHTQSGTTTVSLKSPVVMSRRPPRHFSRSRNRSQHHCSFRAGRVAFDYESREQQCLWTGSTELEPYLPRRYPHWLNSVDVVFRFVNHGGRAPAIAYLIAKYRDPPRGGFHGNSVTVMMQYAGLQTERYPTTLPTV
ncbi:hypothetical protein E8E13_007018 [Curvularia kusanoi]|uniref:Uncharacterized protein n=1 Tax=Curvularia kusanoi TaxID=90978 RepID=A0A9P4W9R9_CURKU|nr:hypothetical protein E8E13_007018 [Curvularia kusanoi]